MTRRTSPCGWRGRRRQCQCVAADSPAEFTLRAFGRGERRPSRQHRTACYGLPWRRPNHASSRWAVTLSVESSTGGTVELPLAGGVPTPIQTQISKLPWVEFTSLTPYEIVLKTYDVPLAELAKQAEGWDRREHPRNHVSLRHDQRRHGLPGRRRVGRELRLD